MQDPRHGQRGQARGGQGVQRGAFGLDQVPGQRIDADLGESRRLAARGEQLEHRLAVSPGRPQVGADQHLVAENGTQIRLNRACARIAGAGGRIGADPQPSAQADAGPARRQGQRQGPAARPGPHRPGLAVAADRGGASPPAGRHEQPGAARGGQHDKVPFAGAEGPGAAAERRGGGGGHSTAQTSPRLDRPAAGRNGASCDRTRAADSVPAVSGAVMAQPALAGRTAP